MRVIIAILEHVPGLVLELYSKAKLENQSESLTDGRNRSPEKSEITAIDSFIDDKEPETIFEDGPSEHLAAGSGNSRAQSRADIKYYRSSPKLIRHNSPTDTDSRSSLVRHQNESLSKLLASSDRPEEFKVSVRTEGSELCAICHAALQPQRFGIKGPPGSNRILRFVRTTRPS